MCASTNQPRLSSNADDTNLTLYFLYGLFKIWVREKILEAWRAAPPDLHSCEDWWKRLHQVLWETQTAEAQWYETDQSYECIRMFRSEHVPGCIPRVWSVRWILFCLQTEYNSIQPPSIENINLLGISLLIKLCIQMGWVLPRSASQRTCNLRR